MEGIPEVRYTRSGGVNIAYTRWGRGSDVVVYTPPLASNVEIAWESTEWVKTSRHAGDHHQCVMIDKRGVGLSDRVSEPPTLDDRVADTLAVMDAEHIDAAHLVGQSEGGAIAIALAASHPSRVKSLVLIGAPAMGVPQEELAALEDADDPLPSLEEMQLRYRNLIRYWGSEESVNLQLFAPGVAEDPVQRRWYQRYERQSASPGTLLGFLKTMIDLDVRPLLPHVHVPALVVQMRGDRIVHVSNGRYLARAIPNAKYIEYDDDAHIWMFAQDWRRMHDDMIEFMVGKRPDAPPTAAFAVVLFTDIVDSTALESRVGNPEWRKLLDVHDRVAHHVVTRHRGRIVKQTGDGLLATFGNPGDALSAAFELSRELEGSGLPIRAGLHAGVVEVREDEDITGITVNIAARVQSKADANEVLVSETLRDVLLGTDIEFVDRGEHELKGLDRAWRLYAAIPG